MPQGNNDDDSSGWQAQTDVADDTVRVPIVCKEDDRETWEEEAAEQGYPNRSRYLIDLIQEARILRQEEALNPRQAEKKIAELQAEIQRLEERLANEQQAGAGSVSFDDPRFVERFLTENYQPLSDILQQILESGAVEQLIRKPVEDQLYFLAAQEDVEYERGWGWKLADGTGGE